MLRLHTVARERERERERERRPPPNPTEFSERKMMSSCLIIASSLTLPKFTIFSSPNKPVARHESISFHFGLPMLIIIYSLKLSNDLHSGSKILANLTAN